MSGVWVRVSGPNLGQSLESEFKVKGLSLKFGARVRSLGQSLGPEPGVWVRVWVKVWGQSLESGSEFGAGVWMGRVRVQSLIQSGEKLN